MTYFMLEKISKYNYSKQQIIKIGLICTIICGIINLSLGLYYGIYVYPESFQSILYFTLWKNIFIVGGYLITGITVFYRRLDLDNIITAWLSIFTIGFFSAIFVFITYMMTEDVFRQLNCETSLFSGCNYVTDMQVVGAILISFMILPMFTFLSILFVKCIGDLFTERFYLK